MSENKENFIIETLKFSLIAILIVLPFRIFIAQPFLVSGASMSPNFETGHYLIVDQLSYNFQNPQRGEVIVFRYPKNPKKFFIKRIIGLPGETVILNEHEIIIKNKENPDGFKMEEIYLGFHSNENLKITLAEEEYYVMGDNRPASSDSRAWGVLQKELIIGRAFIRLFPFNQIELFPEYVEDFQKN